MEKGFFRESSKYCPECGHQSITICNINGKPLNFVIDKGMTTDQIMKKVNKTTIGNMVCSNCGKQFLCDYSLGFPRAVTKSGLRMTFFEDYLSKNK